MKALSFIAVLLISLSGRLYAANPDSAAKSYYYQAKQHLENMLAGNDTPSYERAIYEIENAWWEGNISYAKFDRVIQYCVDDIQEIADIYRDSVKGNPKEDLLETKEQKRTKYEKALVNFAIFKYMTNVSLLLSKNQLIYHEPYAYAYSDPMGTTDWRNTQVTNLLKTKSGNCFALASLFAIFSEKLNSEARLCTAPGHIYIRHADDKGTYYNVEVASRAFPGTGTIETLTYTSDEATKNNISLRELDQKQAIALCLVYLAKGYEYKFREKDDDFMLSCANLALQYDDHNLNAMLLKAEVLENRLVRQNKTIKQLQANKDLLVYQQWITHIFALGYREMPYNMKNILMKGWMRDTVLPVQTKDNTPEHLANKNLPPMRYASLSWGAFDEEIHTKPLERYDNTVFDTKHKKIVAFVQSDVLFNQYAFDPVVFAMSVDPMAHKFPSQSPYTAFGGNPIENIDVDGAYQYPAKKAAGYARDYPMITIYLAKYVQNDIRKSQIVQNAVVKNTYGGYTKDELVNTVASWGNKNSPEITFKEGLAEQSNAYGHTSDAKHFEIDAGFAKKMDDYLGDKNVSAKDKQAAITKFYETLLDETTHTGDLKDHSQSAPEVGGDARNEIFHSKVIKDDGPEYLKIYHPDDDDDVSNKADLSGTKSMIDRKTKEGQTEVLPTVPTK